MCPFTNLFVGHLRAGVPVGGQHRIAEGTRSVGIGALADVEHAVVLLQGDGRVERSDARFLLRLALGGCDVANCLDHLAQVFGCGAAAATHHGDAEVLYVMAVELGQLRGRQVVVRLAVNNARQTRIGQHTDGNR